MPSTSSMEKKKVNGQTVKAGFQCHVESYKKKETRGHTSKKKSKRNDLNRTHSEKDTKTRRKRDTMGFGWLSGLMDGRQEKNGLAGGTGKGREGEEG